MKLFRFGEAGSEHPGVLTAQGKYLDVSAFGEDYEETFFGSEGPARLKKWLESNEAHCPVLEPGFRFGPPTRRPSKLICIG